MARPTTVAQGGNYLKSYVAAAQILEGALVKRSADGTVTPCVDETQPNHLGVAASNPIEQDVLYKYAQYAPVPVIINGVAKIWVLEADITAGMYLKVANDFGMCNDDGDKAEATSVCKALEDVATASYTTAGLAATAGTKALTVTSTATYFAAGDVVLLDGGSDATSEVAVIDEILTATSLTVKESLAKTYSAKHMHMLGQCEVEIIP